jgi:hypothetical protein
MYRFFACERKGETRIGLSLAKRFHLIVWRFSPGQAKNDTISDGSTMLPQAKPRLKARPRKPIN